MNTQEAIAKLDALTAKVQKVQKEVQALKDTVGNRDDVPQEVVDAIDRVDNALTAVDDINEDAPPETTGG